ncbi:oleoyl-ACP hydrolase [Streptomyces cinereoruber]|uniref:Oleoyl-ACP hydrolase n=1 Tax=Streptomyces cinereoruber TaxID=67260 RepID=A0AAV4KSI5_9ACTN|nr:MULTISPECIES: alpha/beta fold hydrolase [Streptomyces]AVH94790.1 thioesterase [Streptomyces sp. WAC00288]MBB4157543.1 surfactin synthase thioesterase subunit [Streptomyces cinereoruber]MBY8819908.1 alpha/beta fold hydrolase [Streptomyces cinereoruber]NIH62304.1 surfactin synthase thioesterase subunit [Streptomyces cinereoruber]PVC77210.1 thioesterase [Streptomyces sp. CS081A]
MAVLALLHHAGGSAAVFRRLTRLLPGHVEPLAAELPGRGRRWREPAVHTAQEAVDDLTDLLARNVGADEELSILGHSMGAYLGLGVAAALERRAGPRCQVLFASANLAPRLAAPLFAEDEAPASDEEVLRRAARFGALDARLLRDPHIAARAVSVLRADFAVCDSFVRTMARTVTESRVVVCRGREDVFGDEHTDQWQWNSTQPLSTRTFPGGHLYLESAGAEPLAATIAAALTEPAQSRT